MALASTQSNPLEDYNKEMSELKILVKDALEKKGVLAKVKVRETLVREVTLQCTEPCLSGGGVTAA